MAVFSLRTNRSKPEQQEKQRITTAAGTGAGAANAVAPQTIERTGERIKMQCRIESVCACKTYEHTRIRLNAINHGTKIEQTMAMLVYASKKVKTYNQM